MLPHIMALNLFGVILNFREALAKAKRLVRFNKELSEPLKELKKENISGKRQEERKDEAQKVNIESLNEDTVNGSTHGDQEGPKPCKVVGLCLDMCPGILYGGLG